MLTAIPRKPGGINRTSDLDGTDGTHPHSKPEGRDTKKGLALLAHAEWRRRQNKSLLDFFKNRGRAPSESRCRNSETSFFLV